MELRRFYSTEEFYRRAEPFLLEREAEHNLILGICSQLIRYPERIEQQPYMATVERDGEVVAAALRTPPWNPVLSYVAADEAIPMLAGDLYGEYTTLPGVVASVPFSKAFSEEWQRLSSQPYELHMAERIYKLEEVRPIREVPGKIRRATEEDRDLLYPVEHPGVALSP